MAAPGKPEENLKLKSGWLCLDFANTAEWHLSEHPTEHLTSYAELIAWARSISSSGCEAPRRNVKLDRQWSSA